MKKALIYKGKVIQVAEKAFPVSKSFKWEDCPDDCFPGWTENDGTIEAPPEKSDTEKLAERLKELAALRYQKETAGIKVGGVEVLTDRLTQSMLTGALVLMNEDPTMVVDWKGKKGWARANAETIRAIAISVGQHVQACFTREKELTEALETDLETDITTGWPV